MLSPKCSTGTPSLCSMVSCRLVMGFLPFGHTRWRSPLMVPPSCPASRRGAAERYTRIMKSVASVLRERTAADIRRLTPAERVELALRLGDEAIESFRAAGGVDRGTAIRLLERRRQATRRPSACLDRLIG